jgi:hypothetical protein
MVSKHKNKSSGLVKRAVTAFKEGSAVADKNRAALQKTAKKPGMIWTGKMWIPVKK